MMLNIILCVATLATNAATRAAKITAEVTRYDRKEGIVFFDRHVHVDDERYQLWADRAYVFLNGTNELRRVVAIGKVAMTNETRRAYGEKVSYYHDAGMAVLYAPTNGLCEVRDETKDGVRSVTGTKIKFWIDSGQVEVLGAEISAPVGGIDKDALIKRSKKL